MNTGIGDAVDLGWKLAAVLSGWGGERLLSSYDSERRPIGMRNVGLTDRVLSRPPQIRRRPYGHRGGQPSRIADAAAAGQDACVRRRRMFRTIGLQLGYRYENSPICVPDGTPPVPDDPEDYVPSARPGSRAPHTWLDNGSSMLDLYGRGFVLLLLGTNPPDVSAFDAAASARGVPLKSVTVTAPDAARLYDPLVLVRPDGHVAWRGHELPPNPLALVDKVRGGKGGMRHSMP